MGTPAFLSLSAAAEPSANVCAAHGTLHGVGFRNTKGEISQNN